MAGFMFDLPDGRSMDVREVLVETLIYHQRADVGHCACGWGVLGESHAEHIADVFEESVVARAS